MARLGKRVITVDDVQEQLNRREAFIRTRYQAPEKKKEFLDSLVRFELLAEEAEKKGYPNDPDLIRMYKQWLVARLVQKDFDPQFDPAAIPAEEVSAYYESHKQEMQRPEQARASDVTVKTEAIAQKVAERARKLAKADEHGFTELVLGYSENGAVQRRGGDLGILLRSGGNSQVPQAVIDAVFALQNPGDIAGPIKAEDGYHVVRLTGKQPAQIPSLEEMEPHIREKINKERRDKGMTAWVDRLKADAKIEVFEDRLAQIKVDTTSPPKFPERAPVFKIAPELVPGAQQ
ncbi:MAG: peptidylprolyl isomerase [Deltaproteobacteria bacterium]|nr:peptidylprolyl isomerase [Deltaproteobacteria bacterium]